MWEGPQGKAMARVKVPAVAFGWLFFIGAGLAGVLAFVLFGGGGLGLVWAICVFLAVLTAWVAVAVLRSNNESAVEQP